MDEETDIIIPPPVVTEIIHKTASFVAKHGRAFEEKISKSGQGTKTKFQFLDPTNPYNAYYEKKIQDIIRSDNSSENTTEINDKDDNNNNNNNNNSSGNEKMNENKQNDTLSKHNIDNNNSNKEIIDNMNTADIGKKAIISLLAKLPLETNIAVPTTRFDVNHPGTVSTLLIDIIKLCAQYTAIAGKEFLPGLLARETNNVQFNFLQPGSMYFNYFTAMVDSYSLALNPDENIRDRVKIYENKDDKIHDGMACLRECVVKYKHEQTVDAEQNRNKNLVENDGVNGLIIDWQDFVIVETINFDDGDTKDNNQERSGANANLLGDQVDIVANHAPAINNNNNNSNNNNYDENDNNMTMVSDDEEDGEEVISTQQQQQQMVSSHSDNDNMAESDDAMSESDDDGDDDSDDDDNNNGIEVRTDYQPNISGRMLPSLNVIDPKSGLAVPVGNIEEHMRVELMDPKWKEEQIRAAEKRKNTNVADGSSISDNLAAFASKVKRQKISEK